MHLRERELGDMIQEALSFVGITQERVSKWLGRPCNCQERVQKLNLISIWAKRVLSGKTDNAEKYLNQMIDEEQ